MKRQITSLTLAAALITATLSGCSGSSQSGTSTASASTASASASASAASTAGTPKFSDIQFPENLPAGITQADNTKYGYDDLSKHYTLSILQTNYGTPALSEKEDAICQYLEKKFNVTIKVQTVNQSDLKTTISTQFASGDLPDLFDIGSDNTPVGMSTANMLDSQGLLVDARTIYPYMPQWCKYTTKNMIAASYNDATGNIPFITHYAIQDTAWGFAIRKDWLKKFNMAEPKTEDELLAYAKACTFNDPDGDGKADTYFMTGAGGGNGFGMLGGFNTMFGNPSPRVENGKLVHPIFDGTEQKYLTFLNKLYNAKVLAPDWYTIDWSKKDTYLMNDKLGMAYYPTCLLTEYSNAKNKDIKSLNVWEWYPDAPIQGGKYAPSGNIGYMWGFTKQGFSDEGKLKRVAHMLDTMVVGGENFFRTIQGGADDEYQAIGVKVTAPRTWKYNSDGTFYFTNSTKGDPYNNKKYDPEGIWQMYGLGVTWQRNAPTGEDEFQTKMNVESNKSADVLNKYPRWSNDGLLCNVPIETLAPGLSDWVNAQELNFVTNKRSLSTDWSNYQKEWLNKGGRKIIEAQAKKLKVPTPDYAK
ncbi:MAG TPA: extracellular solute-binding protein [Caproiciproducens sp.]|nr:extracellular solute-binding protein [Caproiciproducens sp.]